MKLIIKQLLPKGNVSKRDFIQMWLPLARIQAGFTTKPCLGFGSLIFIAHGGISLFLGYKMGFLSYQPIQGWRKRALLTLKLFFLPSISEEVVFRGCLFPNKVVDATSTFEPNWLTLFGALSVTAFVIYHLSPFHKPKEVKNISEILEF